MLRLVDRPTSFPVSLNEAKAQLRVADSSSDAMINGLIAAATVACETLVQRAFVSRTYEWVLPCWRSELRIPIAPVVAAGIASIKYVDLTSQAQQTLDRSAYVAQTRGESVVIFPKFGTLWPLVFVHSSEPIVIQFDAGYEDIGDLPPNVKAAILLQLRHLYALGENSPALMSETVFGVGQKQFQMSAAAAAIIPDAVRQLMLSEVW
jgi:uncharacterized phiE125 gp8 family phage protein